MHLFFSYVMVDKINNFFKIYSYTIFDFTKLIFTFA
jgi:hypothetical protein